MGCQVISWEFEKVTDYEADSDMVTEMEAACSVLHQMRFTQLSEVESEFRPLSSVGSRGKCRVLSLVVAAVRGSDDGFGKGVPQNTKCTAIILVVGFALWSS